MDKFKDLLIFLAGWIRPFSFPLVLGCIFLSAGGLLLLSIPHQFGRLVADFPRIQVSGLVLIISILSVRGILVFFGSRNTATVAAELVCKIRRFLFKKFIYAPVSFHDQNMSSNLVSTITTDAVFIEQLLQSLFATLAQHGTIIFFGFSYLIIFHLRLFVVLVATGLPGIYFLLMVGKKLRQVSREGQQSIANVAVTAQESLKGLNLIKRLVLERYFYQLFSLQIEKLLQLKKRRIQWQSIFTSIFPAFLVLFAAWIIWLVRSEIVSDRLLDQETAGTMAFLVLLGTSVGRLVQAYVGFEQIIGAVERIKETLPEIQTRLELNSIKPKKIMGPLEIKNVVFTYNQSHAGVFDINLCFDKGDVVGIIGPNGSGKSTLVDLLLRFYAPQQGHIILGGHKSEDVDIEIWRGQFAVLTREPYLFDVSVFDNVALASGNVSRDEVLEAFQNSGLDKIVENLPDGYNTRVCESGVLLSTGQRQLVSLTRIFLQNPLVVILDEALVCGISFCRP